MQASVEGTRWQIDFYWRTPGDKEPAFIGSSQWVGAVVLSYVLDQLLGVSSKIITVAKGSELPARAREIAHHFDTQGAHLLPSLGGLAAHVTLVAGCVGSSCMQSRVCIGCMPVAVAVSCSLHDAPSVWTGEL